MIEKQEDRTHAAEFDRIKYAHILLVYALIKCESILFYFIRNRM